MIVKQFQKKQFVECLLTDQINQKLNEKQINFPNTDENSSF
jgi:hypothetical protein